MNALRQEIHNFDPDHFGTLADLLHDSECNVQDTLMVACADHGTAPDNVTFAGPNRLFIVQNMAESVPAASSLDSSSTLGSIEYAIRVLHVEHAIICGHLGCGIIPAWLRIPVANTRSDVQSNFNTDARAVVDETYSPADADERIALTVREHTLFQLENLQSHEFVQARLQVGDLRLHA